MYAIEIEPIETVSHVDLVYNNSNFDNPHIFLNETHLKSNQNQSS
jgi:hypothetical protein